MPAARKVTIDKSGNEITAHAASAPPTPPTRADTVVAMEGDAKESTFAPWDSRISRTIRDPLYRALNFQWSDRQQIGRATYDKMYQHGAVAGPFDSLVSFLKSFRPVYKPNGTDPTKEQRQYADFANEQLRRLGSSGDSRQGYEKFIEWIGQGLKYGFTLAEMERIRAPWQGQSRIQIQRLLPLPQASLDNGETVLEEFGQLPTRGDQRYRCFRLDSQGRIESITQYQNTRPEGITWAGAELLTVLHFTHGGTEGNPYGQSILFTAFQHWADLYTLEQMETAFLDSSLPYLTVSYKTIDGRPSPALHEQFLDTIKKQDPSVRALIMPDTTFGSTAPSNPSFTEHAKQKKMELRRYIYNCIMGIPASNSETGNELDARNSIQTFFTYILPALQREIATLLEAQFARRLIDANWSNLSDSDYPKLVFQSANGGNDLRIALPLIQQITPFVDTSRLGEMFETLIPGFDRDWIPTSHKQSVAVQRETPDPAAQGGSVKKPSGTKPEGVKDTQHTGETSTVGQDVGN